MEDLKVWSIGENTELYAAHSEEEVKKYYRELVGDEEAEEAFADHFELVAEGESLDEEAEYDCDGEKKMVSFRQLIQMNGPVPTMVSTSYN